MVKKQSFSKEIVEFIRTVGFLIIWFHSIDLLIILIFIITYIR